MDIQPIMMVQPSMSPVPFRNMWCNDFDFEVEVRGHKIVVPGFFLFDGASIPKILWALAYHPFDTRVIMAALVHDWLYWNHQVSKEEADLIFLTLLLMNGTDPLKAHLMYEAVAKFGESSWALKEEEKPLLQLLYLMVKDSPRFVEFHFPVEALA